ncbi:MAG: lipoprotein [Pseudolabrys sp.]
MSQLTDRLFFRLALIGALAAAFGLAGCGRKGPLDPPPSAVSATGQQEPAKTDLIRSPYEKPAEKTKSAAGKAPNKSFVLDPLLN